jgi:hypothetical protein
LRSAQQGASRHREEDALPTRDHGTEMSKGEIIILLGMVIAGLIEALVIRSDRAKRAEKDKELAEYNFRYWQDRAMKAEGKMGDVEGDVPVDV